MPQSALPSRRSPAPRRLDTCCRGATLARSTHSPTELPKVLCSCSNRAMPRHELARLKLMRQPMRSRVAQIVQPCEKSGLARSFAQAQSLEPKDHKAYLRTLLYPARFCYSWITGLMGSNDAAVTFLSERHVAGLDVSLIDRAHQCRRDAADPDALFPARALLPAQIEACAALLIGGDRHPR